MGAHHGKLTLAKARVGQRVWLAGKYRPGQSGRICGVRRGWIWVSWDLCKPHSAHRRGELRVEAP